MPLRHLLLISQPGSYRLAPYIHAATRMGLRVMVASRGEYSLISEVHAGLHIDPDRQNEALGKILKQNAKTPFCGVLGSDDGTVELAAKVAQELGLPHNPPAAARLTRRKDLARARLTATNCPVPQYAIFDLSRSAKGQLENFAWPRVLKPLNMSAGRGVMRSDDEAAFAAACERIKPIVAESADAFEQSHILVEQYIDGIEVAYEGWLDKGELHDLALFDKPDPLTGPFFEETLYITPSRLDKAIQKQIRRTVAQACTAYGLNTGPVHAELRIDKDSRAWILEVASRTIGGDCARTLDSGGFNLEELTLSLASGATVKVEPLQGARGVMMLPIKQGGILRRVEGIGAARRVPHIEKVDIIIRNGNPLVPLPEGNQYPGYLFARADTPQAVERALRSAHEKLKFITMPALSLKPDVAG